MRLNRPSRRYVGARLTTPPASGLRLGARLERCLPARLAICLGLLLVLASPAVAQHGGMGGGMGGGRAAGSMGGNRDGMEARGLDQPPSHSRTGPHSGLQLGLGGRWWDERKTAKKLNLSSDQQRRMDDIFETNKPTLVNLFVNLQREQTHLATLSPNDLQDQTRVFAAIDRVSQARDNLDKEYAHVLIQIRQQLDPQQLQTLDHEIASLQ